MPTKPISRKRRSGERTDRGSINKLQGKRAAKARRGAGSEESDRGIRFESLETRQLMSASILETAAPTSSTAAALTVSASPSKTSATTSATTKAAASTIPANAIVVSAGQSIQAAINSASAGATIYVKNGVYGGNLEINKSVTIVGESRTGVFVEGYVTGGHNVTLKNFTVRNVKNGLQNETAAVRTNSGWKMTDVTVENVDGTGVGVFGENIVITGLISRYNGANGIGGVNAKNVLVTNSEWYQNNRGKTNPAWAGHPEARNIGGKWFVNAAWEGGGGKWFFTDGVTIRNVKAYENGGPGIWFDAYNKNYVVENCEAYGNTYTGAAWEGIGIGIEINDNGIVRNNYVHDNSGAGIAIQESEGVLVEGNTFVNDGLEFRALGGRPRVLKNVNVKNNFFKSGAAFVSVGGGLGGRNVVLSANTYQNEGDKNAGAGLGETGGKVGTVAIPKLNAGLGGDGSTDTGGNPGSGGGSDNGGTTDPVADPVTDPVPAVSTVTDKQGVKWTLVDSGDLGKQIARDGVIDPITNNVEGLYYDGKTLYQTAHGNWYKLEGEAWVQLSTDPRPAAQVKPATKPSGDFDYLSDLPFNGEPVNEWGPVERDESNGKGVKGDGSTITLGNYTYTKGIGFHANAEVSYKLNGQYKFFSTDIGIDDAAKAGGASVLVEVWGDGKLLEHITIEAGQASRLFTANVNGVKVMTIKAKTSDPDNALVSMGHARLFAAAPSTSKPGGNTGGNTGGSTGGSTGGTGVKYFDGGGIGPDNTFVDNDYCIDLGSGTWAKATNGYGPVERNQSNGGKAAKDGQKMSINGRKFNLGLGVHAGSEIVYNLNGHWDWFNAWVGIDDSVGKNGSATFQVWADGTKLFDSGVMKGVDSAKWIDVPLHGKKQMKLVVLSNGDTKNDHANWADAKLIKEKATGQKPVSSSKPGSSGGTGSTGGGTSGKTYVSDLKLAETSNGWGPTELDMSNGEKGSKDGKTISIGGTQYRKGLGVHSDSKVVLDLNGKYSEFRADIGVDDEVGKYGSVSFEVWADGKRIYQSNTLTGADDAKKCVVNVKGVDQLWLVVTDAGNGNTLDHAAWGGAYLKAA